MKADAQKRVALPMHVAPDLCTPCGGKCCKGFPGLTLPEDWGNDVKTMATRLKSALASGRYAIDWWEGDPRPGSDSLDRVRYVRPAIRGHEGEVVHPSWGGACTFLTPKGCSLTHDARPWGCRDLTPVPGDGECEASVGKQAQCVEWIPLSDLLDRVTMAMAVRS